MEAALSHHETIPYHLAQSPARVAQAERRALRRLYAAMAVGLVIGTLAGAYITQVVIPGIVAAQLGAAK